MHTSIWSTECSPCYGERWGRHWLDAARYADSNGGDENHAYLLTHRYRNYVIEACNADVSFDEFIRQQLAGDLLPATGNDRLDAMLEARLQSFELAFKMQTAAPEAVDLSNESASTRKLYGLDDAETANFGRECLLARSFAERGVRFIQVSHAHTLPFINEQWDQHTHLAKGHSINVKQIDKPITGLLKDLRQRGLLDDTLVIWGGEFGRTPTVQKGNAEVGRDHHPEGFTMWMARAGVKSGCRYGTTDEFGYYGTENRCTIHDFHATILHLLGIDHERLTYLHAGRDFRLTDVHGVLAEGLLA